MRWFVQTLVLIVGFAVAIAAVETEKRSPSVSNCYEITASDAPAICN